MFSENPASHSAFYKRKFEYRGFRRLGIGGLRLSGLLIILLAWFVFPGFFVYAALNSEWSDAWQSVLCFGGWSIFIGFWVGGQFLTYAPNVWIGDKGIAVSSLHRWIELPWDDIIDIRSRFFLYGGFRVRTRRLTPYHRILGLLDRYGPSFVIDEGMPDVEELVRLIRRGIGDWN